MMVLVVVLLALILAAILGGAEGVRKLAGLFWVGVSALILFFMFLVYLGRN